MAPPPPAQSRASNAPAENHSNPQASASSSAQNPTGAQASAAIASASRRGIENQTINPQTTEPITKKKRHRGGKKHKKRRQSFAADPEPDEESSRRPSLMDLPERESEEARESFYRLGRGQRGSATSLESEALLDHRDQNPLQARRQSIAQGGISGRLGSQLTVRKSAHRPSMYSNGPQSRSRLQRPQNASDSEDDNSADRAPLLGRSYRSKGDPPRGMTSGYGGVSSSPNALRHDPFYDRRPSKNSSRSSHRRIDQFQRPKSPEEDYDVNNPPSVPGSPKFGAEMGYDDVMLTGADLSRGRASEHGDTSRDALIDIDNNIPIDRVAGAASPSPGGFHRRMTLNPAEDDVCFPHEALTEVDESVVGDEDKHDDYTRPKRRGRKVWPDLGILQEWADEEKEQRTTERIRARKVSEPLMVGGRLRPQKFAWHRAEEEEPMRFTYFNEDFQATLHSQSMSELPQEGQSFRNLFIPDPPLLSDSESEDDEDTDPFLPHDNGNTRNNGSMRRKASMLSPGPLGRRSRADFDRSSSRAASDRKADASKANSSENTGENTRENTPVPKLAVEKEESPKRYGTRPIWWLDVLSPTDAEMKLLSKSFGIHPLTAEDVMMQEQREKVELFRNYYFVNYRTFEQDTNSEDYMEPINMYVVVFREGVISFHFSQTPHPANVRRRIRQLKDYLILTTDWISYAIIDDITDAYAPLIQRIEEEVDVIDETILTLHAQEETAKSDSKYKKTVQRSLDYPGEKESDSGDTAIEAGDMLRRVGECRKKVMSLYRLLGNKADVIKGFAKRCNEQWEIAPKSEIGLYLGDIQDHIVTMTGNLSHYENLLSRAHSNYLAQINIRMNERAEKTNDVLGKLTVLGTIVLPMNIVTGMWGMNVPVPGQETTTVLWFWCITAGLVVFGFSSFFIAKRTYGIV
ncbi:hypothetical protein EG328_003967 [Venturia inaequalis]|uniref:Uncharacterized protein n=1 Tax=Venturia inaequalis TaxID=5025 RepID=A0A8H3URC5_VENIN|nr:hypothetical protein EG328_003967 [Venturia inaequalis]KAE9979900.1 hypothetical protein EG327_006870 [Venturia inaequalis]